MRVSADVMHIATLLCPTSRVPLSSFGPLLAELPVSQLQPAGALLPAVEGESHCVPQHAACIHACHAFMYCLTSLDAAHNAVHCQLALCICFNADSEPQATAVNCS